MHELSTLKPGDSIEIIAPASRCTDNQLDAIKKLFKSWGLNCVISHDIFGDDLLCANSDEIRFNSLKNALQNPTTKAIICARGGYGSMRLIPQLTQITPTTSPKIFVGMSDITALNLYLQQQWQWPTIHSAPALDKFSQESIAKLKSFLFGEMEHIEFQAVALNNLAEKHLTIEASITGGNLCLAQTSIGTQWQLNGDNKIIFLEEIGERGYRVDRMLEHMRQANIFKNAAAILFGDFIEGNEPDGSSLISPVLERFAQSSEIPVIQVQGIGHGHTNYPIPLGTKTKLQLGRDIRLLCFR
jgi:muramoyltetrapeptide carboxypeptidase